MISKILSNKIVRYIISGGTGATVNLLFLYLFTDIFGFWYINSAIVAFLIAFVVSFLLQKFWTFREVSTDKIHAQASVYLIVGLANLVLNTLLLYFFVDILDVWYMLGQFLASGIVALWSFFIYKIIFKKKNDTPQN